LVRNLMASNPSAIALGERIQERREHLELTQENIARHFDIALEDVQQWESGAVPPTGRTLRELRILLKCSLQWLLTGEAAQPAAPEPSPLAEAPPKYAPVPFIAMRAGATGQRYLESEALGSPKYFEEQLIRELRAQPTDLRAVEIEGESMEPLLRNGDQVLVDTRKTSVVEPGLFVVFDGDGLVCKWVERMHGSSERMLRFKSENPRFEAYLVAETRAQIIGRVVWLARRL
jgi:phage repressor protein C with HTH and peptisase S24 domain